MTAPAWSGRAGAAATVVVRPERLRVTAGPSSNGACLAATVHDVVFQGPVVRCLLRASDGTELVAHLGPEYAGGALHPGQTIWLNWDDDAARLLPAAS